MMGFGMGFSILGVLIMLVFWVGLIFLAVWLVKSVFSSSNRSSNASTTPKELNAMEILAQRYARGEITRDQYEMMKHDLQ